MTSNTQDDAHITVSCTTEYPAYKLDKASKCWGLVTLKASDYEPEESKRPTLDIVAVIDRSGSMKGEKLFLVKKSLKFLVQNLLEKDRLSVVTYDTGVTVDFHLLAMNKDNKKFAESKIELIQPGSSTNLCGGLLQGLCTILDRGETKTDVASVLLFTDGLANHGITRKEEIIKAMKNPKKYLKESYFEMTHFDMMMQYQNNSTPAVSYGNISSGAPPNRYQPGASQGSFLSRSLRRVVNYFTQSTTEQAPAQNVCEDEEDEQGNAIILQQNIAPEAAQNIQVQQALQEPTHNVQQLAETAVQPDPEHALQPDPKQAIQPDPEQALQPDPEQALQLDPEQALQPDPEQALQPDPEQALQPHPEQALQQSPEILEQPAQDTQQVVQAEEALQQATQVTEAAPPETNEAVNEEKKDKKNIEASVYTFGFGSDHDPDLLKAISDAANGMYYFIENEEQISESFGHCFGGLVSTLGQNIELTLELCDGVSIDTIHTDRNNTSDDTKKKWKVQFNDMQSEEERDVLLTIKLPRTDSSTTTILKSSIKYFCVIHSSYKYSEAEMSVNRSADAKYSPEVANLAIDRQRNRIVTSKATKEALELADNGDLELARKRLKEEINRVKESLTKDDELCKLLVIDMEKCLEGLRDYRLYSTSGKKYQMNLLQMHSTQRSSRPDGSSCYENVSKMSHVDKFK
ncbi:Hypothetical predicted protein [Paramuricea clavata]|uniref:Uncharacterized protein n=1 Tax=Paramuricea clavata TaxID=317549 RepID=A0A7D9DC35_PARCT|nr:Hypothetical predicted protein [Paramuricea clavata]